MAEYSDTLTLLRRLWAVVGGSSELTESERRGEASTPKRDSRRAWCTCRASMAVSNDPPFSSLPTLASTCKPCLSDALDGYSNSL